MDNSLDHYIDEGDPLAGFRMIRPGAVLKGGLDAFTEDADFKQHERHMEMLEKQKSAYTPRRNEENEHGLSKSVNVTANMTPQPYNFYLG